MLCISIGGVRLRASFWFFAVAAAVLLYSREVLFFYLALPVAVHEGGHLLAMALCGARVEEIALTPFSVDIRRGGRLLSYGRELAVCLAGAGANALFALYLYLFAFQSLRTMFLIGVNVALALFNLLPIGNLDGGAAAELLAERLGFPRGAVWVSRICSLGLLTALFAAAILLWLRGMPNLTLFLTCVYLAAVVVRRERE